MERLSERLASAAAFLFAVGAVAAAWLGGWTGRETAGGLVPFHLAGLAVSAFTWMRCTLHRRAEEERRDRALAPAHETADTRLFGETAEGEPFSAARSEALFERFAVAGAAPAMAVLLGAFAAWRFRRLSALALPSGGSELSAASIFVVLAFVFFLFGRYLLALGRTPERRVLRPVGILLGLVPPLHLAAAVLILAVFYGVDAADRYGALALALVLAVLATEMAVLSMAEIYRPRRSSAGPQVPYESRLSGLLVAPSGMARGAGRALDYQFGFRVSETWFYRFLERALIPLVCLQAVLLYGLSSIVVLGPEEEAVVERFGRAEPGMDAAAGRHLPPGLHVKWPWPFETVRRFPARRIQSFAVGFKEGEEAEPMILWTRPHFEREDLFLVASREDLPATEEGAAAVPVNLLTYAMRVEYRVADLHRFLYGHARPEQALRDIAYRALTRESASRGLFDILGEGYENISRSVHGRIQADADRLGIGAEIVGVLFQGVHPPVAVAEDFEAVVGAMEEREAIILEAGAYRNRRLPVALAEARERIYRAEAYRARRIAVSEAESGQFLSRREGYLASPRVFRARHHLETIRNALQDARLYLVVTDPDREVLQINFEERMPATLFDASPAGGN